MNWVSNFRISEPLKMKLREKEIETLFRIQALTFNTILNGFDLIVRALTGQGKTLAYVLPILESLTNGPAKSVRKVGDGRVPSVLVLVRTRELAFKVKADFEFYGSSLGLTTCAISGGAAYGPQETKLKRGVDIVTGTPSRIKDHIERGNIDLSHLKFHVIDETDEILMMGYDEAVQVILGKVQYVTKVQTLLFSATFPSCVKQVCAYMSLFCFEFIVFFSIGCYLYYLFPYLANY